MAVWQFDFYLIRKDKINFYNESKPWASDDNNENLLIWDNKELNINTINKIAKLLPIEKNWSDTTEQFGNIDNTCLQISYLEGGKCQIYFRLDLRSLDREVLLEILRFIDSHNAALIYDNKCYEVDENSLLNLIANSNASKFCENPLDFLRKIKKDLIN